MFNILFGNKEIDKAFIDGETTFILSTDEGERHGGVFQNTLCKLVKTIKYKRINAYLIETEQIFTGLDFGIGAIPVNKFFLIIRHPSNFEINKKNDVIVYLPIDINNPLNYIESLPEMKVIDWSFIYDIK